MKPLVWTNDKPTEQGWYWYRDYELHDLTIARVVVKDGELSGVFDSFWCPVYGMDGQWSGPIQPPQEI